MNYINELSKFKDMVLATSDGERVTARSVSTIIANEKIYFQTANDMEKYIQIQNNCKVALTKGFYQVEGRAKSIGKWSDHPKLCEQYQQVHQSSYDSYGTLPEEEVIEVTITRLKLWSYEDDQVYLVDVDCESDNISKTLQAKN